MVMWFLPFDSCGNSKQSHKSNPALMLKWSVTSNYAIKFENRLNDGGIVVGVAESVQQKRFVVAIYQIVKKVCDGGAGIIAPAIEKDLLKRV